MLMTSLFVILSAFIAALLRGFTGFGFSIAAVPLLSLVLPPARVVPLAVVLLVLASVGDLCAAARITDWRSLVWLSPGMVVGTPLGLWILTRMSANNARLTIGALILGSVVVLGRGLRLPAHPPKWMIGLVGVVSGVMNGVAAMSGPPVVAYVMALPHSAVVIRATSLVFFAFTAMVALVPFAAAGLVDLQILLFSLLAWPALLLGSRLGAWAFHRARPHHHRHVAMTTLTALAVVLIVRALVNR